MKVIPGMGWRQDAARVLETRAAYMKGSDRCPQAATHTKLAEHAGKEGSHVGGYRQSACARKREKTRPSAWIQTNEDGFYARWSPILDLRRATSAEGTATLVEVGVGSAMAEKTRSNDARASSEQLVSKRGPSALASKAGLDD